MNRETSIGKFNSLTSPILNKNIPFNVNDKSVSSFQIQK